MRKLSLIITALAVPLIGLSVACGAGGTDKDALPQSGGGAAAPAAEKPSTCDAAREAILTGSKAQIAAALKALQNDKTADATAREYARYYLVRDKGDAQLQEMDLGLISTSCSV